MKKMYVYIYLQIKYWVQKKKLQKLFSKTTSD